MLSCRGLTPRSGALYEHALIPHRLRGGVILLPRLDVLRPRGNTARRNTAWCLARLGAALGALSGASTRGVRARPGGRAQTRGSAPLSRWTMGVGASAPSLTVAARIGASGFLAVDAQFAHLGL